MSDFNLERFKAGEPAYMHDETAVNFVGILKHDICYPILAESQNFLIRLNYRGIAKSTYMKLTMKPVMKKVDWSKLPVDTLINTQVGIRYFAGLLNKNRISYFTDGATSMISYGYGYCSLGISDVTISDKQPWTFWQGGKCPIPDGLEFDAVYRNGVLNNYTCVASKATWSNPGSGGDIIAYRLTGNTLEGYELC